MNTNLGTMNKVCTTCNGRAIYEMRERIYADTRVCPGCRKKYKVNEVESVKRKQGVPVQFGTGDHTWNDLVIMDGDQYEAYLEREKGIKKRSKKSKAEMINLDGEDTTPNLGDEVKKHNLKSDPLS